MHRETVNVFNDKYGYEWKCVTGKGDVVYNLALVQGITAPCKLSILDRAKIRNPRVVTEFNVGYKVKRKDVARVLNNCYL